MKEMKTKEDSHSDEIRKLKQMIATNEADMQKKLEEQEKKINVRMYTYNYVSIVAISIIITNLCLYFPGSKMLSCTSGQSTCTKVHSKLS